MHHRLLATLASPRQVPFVKMLLTTGEFLRSYMTDARLRKAALHGQLWRRIGLNCRPPSRGRQRSSPMLFMITYAFSSDARNAAQDRFKKTGGMPGDGVKMHGRWHAIGGGHGFILAESGDGIAIAKWMQEWTDILEFELIPVNNDEDVMKVLGA